MQYANGLINLNLLNKEFVPMKKDVNKHIVRLIMAYQYSMKKSIELFGKKTDIGISWGTETDPWHGDLYAHGPHQADQGGEAQYTLHFILSYQ